jgi:hypothetical protein
MADLLDKAVTGSRGADTLGKNHRYRYKFELARDANANQILTKYGGFVRLLQRYILRIKISVPDKKLHPATEFQWPAIGPNPWPADPELELILYTELNRAGPTRQFQWYRHRIKR